VSPYVHHTVPSGSRLDAEVAAFTRELGAGTYTVRASYGGGGGFAASKGTSHITVT